MTEQVKQILSRKVYNKRKVSITEISDRLHV